ncbi:hypothetical protein CIHG_01805 [Coccidioides immitis H538.4]|uniref:Uncharacterized protein n=1 Tax=Coccidioides immitis H538.4 TaxID=396776 RepID=A0A0J8RHB0_COCIT|nr:hypothetical protein CIHG_01805 [Coccidioides immitis H538.4]
MKCMHICIRGGSGTTRWDFPAQATGSSSSNKQQQATKQPAKRGGGGQRKGGVIGGRSEKKMTKRLTTHRQELAPLPFLSCFSRLWGIRHSRRFVTQPPAWYRRYYPVCAARRALVAAVAGRVSRRVSMRNVVTDGQLGGCIPISDGPWLVLASPAAWVFFASWEPAKGTPRTVTIFTPGTCWLCIPTCDCAFSQAILPNLTYSSISSSIVNLCPSASASSSSSSSSSSLFLLFLFLSPPDPPHSLDHFFPVLSSSLIRTVTSKI